MWKVSESSLGMLGLQRLLMSRHSSWIVLTERVNSCAVRETNEVASGVGTNCVQKKEEIGGMVLLRESNVGNIFFILDTYSDFSTTEGLFLKNLSIMLLLV